MMFNLFKKAKPHRSAVLLIYTGGTIGMKEDPADGTLKPFDFSSSAISDVLRHCQTIAL